MAVALQTAIKNNLLSAYQSMKMIKTESFHRNQIKFAIPMVSYAERAVGLNPINPTATENIQRSEEEIITLLQSQLDALALLIVDDDYANAQGFLIVAVANIGAVIEYYRLFIN